ncbi:cache domain-containing protein [Candidatus Pacearchaeota archaeon]|nr:cache domain-containing protein [Candidatus Pacearchaeota archaeon]
MKFKKNKLIVSIIVVLIILMFIIVNYANENYKEEQRVHIAGITDSIQRRVSSIFLEINNFPHDAGNDILFLKNSRYLQELINTQDKEDYKNKLEQYFLKFLKSNKVYLQLRYIDENGHEIIKIKFNGSEYKIFSESYLQNKKDKYYFKNTMKLGDEEIYISTLDLNKENGILEKKEWDNSQVYIPTIRYSTPLFDDKGKPKGILISNIDADYFLEDIRRAQKNDEKMFLLDNQGYYIAHPNRSKEFSFIFDGEHAFFKDYPEVNEKILTNFKEKKVETDNNIFTFRFIYPTFGSFELYEGSKKILGDNPGDKYYWILVSVSEKIKIENTVKGLKTKNNNLVLFSGIMIGILFILILLLAYKNGIE